MQEIVEQRLVTLHVGRQMLERTLQNTRPTTAPRWRSAFADESRWSMRAAMRACSVSGTRPLEPVPAPLSMSILMVSSTNSGLPSARSSASCGSAGGGSPVRTRELAHELLDEVGALLLGERLDLDRRRPHPASSPARPCVEQLGPRQTDDEQRRPHAVGEVLDEIEQGRLRPVDVFEQEDERLDVGDPFHHLAGSPRDLLGLRSPLSASMSPAARPSTSDDGLLRAALAELLESFLERVVVRDARRRFDHLAERPVGDALAVRKRTPHENARALESRRRTWDQPALPDAGLAIDREQVGALVSERCGRRCSRGARARPRARRAARAGRPAGRGPSSMSMSRQARSGPSIPFSSSEPESSTTRLPAARRYAVGPTRISPGRAACWSRAARFTASPVANVESASSTTTSPASIPIRASTPSPSTASRMARAARVARCASSSWV